TSWLRLSPPLRHRMEPGWETEKRPAKVAASVLRGPSSGTGSPVSLADVASKRWATKVRCRTRTNHPGARYSAAESDPTVMEAIRRGSLPSREPSQMLGSELFTTYRNCRPLGRKRGASWFSCPLANLVATVTGPPESETRA